jgi:hypothetical protein
VFSPLERFKTVAELFVQIVIAVALTSCLREAVLMDGAVDVTRATNQTLTFVRLTRTSDKRLSRIRDEASCSEHWRNYFRVADNSGTISSEVRDQ